MLASVAVFALSLGRPAVPLARPATARFAAPLCRASTAQSVFEISVDLGEGGGVVQGELTAFFTNSKLVTVRYPVPLVLQASPAKGVVRVEKDGMGLLAGDVLRACSTLEMRYNSQARAVTMGPGFHGRKRKRRVGGQTEIASRSGTRWWERRLSGMVPEALPELGVFTETCPTKVLFIADGQPYSKVVDALTANVPEKTKEVVLVFERPIIESAAAQTETRPLPKQSFSPLTEDDLDGLFRSPSR